MVITLGGDNIFGVPLEFEHNPAATAQQIATFFGISGTQSIFGGGRGRVFMVKGLFYADLQAEFRQFESILETYADGTARTLAVAYPDGSFWSYPFVVYKNGYKRSGKAGLDGVSGQFVQAYGLVLHGLV